MKDKIIVGLSVLVLAMSAYLIYDSANSGLSKAEVESELSDIKTEYTVIQKDLEQNLKSLAVNNEVINAQKKKIENILRKSEITEAELFEAKKLLREISQNVLEEYQRRVQYLQDEKEKLLSKEGSSESELAALQNRLLALEQSKNELSKNYQNEKKENEKKSQLLGYASSLSLSNFELKSYKVRNSGKEIETEKASRISKIKVSFDINENPLAESGSKELFIVVHRPDGQIAKFNNTSSGIFVAEGKKMTYSDKIVVNYSKGFSKSVAFDWENDEFARGEYSIEVYQKTPKRTAKIGGARKILE